MKVAIVAATGGIGRHLLSQAAAAGHHVTVLVRRPGHLPELPVLPQLPVHIVDHDFTAPDPATVEAALRDCDAVLSGLGARTAAEAGVASRGTRVLIEAMQATGGRRIVVVSAASVGTVPSRHRPNPPKHNPGDGFFMRHLAAPIAKAAFRKHYADLARMEDELVDSDLDWTVVRPPRLIERRVTGRYRTAEGQNVRAGMFIGRADVAHYMLAALDRPETVHGVIGIAY